MQGERSRGMPLLGVITTLALILFVSTASGQNACTTPNSTPGSCIPIVNCKYLLDILQNRNKSPADISLLRNSQCGWSNDKPMVCCQQSSQNSCNTPEQTPGRCVSITDCPHLYTLFNGPKPLPAQTVQYIRRHTCQGPSRYSVCCGTAPPPPEVTQPPPITEGTETEGEVPDTLGLLPTGNDCGVDDSADRIFGGNETALGQYPWMVLVEYRTKRQTVALGCGGTLINKRYILTAAHCVAGDVLTQLGTPESIRLGEHDKTTDLDCKEIRKEVICNEKPVTISIESTLAHPMYRPSTGSQKNDIALIRLASDAPYTDYITPICLPTTDISKLNDKSDMVVAGWGTTETGRPSNVKLHLFIKLVNLGTCQSQYNTARLTTELWDKQICAGGEKGKDSCRGDSGGPLMGLAGGLNWVLHGVVSFGPTPCALDNVPGVYTKVFAYMNWIRKSIKP